MIEVQDATGQWKVVTDKEEIETHCILENIHRFTQAKNSPTMQEDQIALFGWQANTRIAQKVLDGESIEEYKVHPALQEMLPFLSTPKAIQDAIPISQRINDEEYCWRWSRSREYTSTGTSGLHFATFKPVAKMKNYASSIDG